MRVPRRGIAVSVAAAVLVAIGAVWLATREPEPPLAAELERLRDESGLFFRPGLLGPGQPNVADSAYGLGILQAAGRPAPFPADALAGRAEDVVAEASVWGRWYLVKIEQATNGILSGDWYQGLLDSWHDEGYFTDEGTGLGDVATGLAATAAALEVLRAKGVEMPSEVTSATVHWLTDALETVSNHYQACNAVTALDYLGQLDPESRNRAAEWLGPDHDLGPLNSFEAVLDTYGYACLSDKIGGGDIGSLRSKIQPALAHPVPDLQLLYYLSMAWRLAGGEPSALADLADAAVARLDPSTGLMVGVADPVGTLESSFYVTEIRLLAGLPTKDSRLAAGVRNAWAEHGQTFGPISLLLTAVLLRLSGDPDPRLESEAVAEVRRLMSAPITRENVSSWVFSQRLLNAIGEPGVETSIEPWTVTSREDRGLAWVAMGLRPYTQGGGVPDGFAAELAAIPDQLATQTSLLTTTEIRAGVEALMAAGEADSVPVAAVVESIHERRGCPGLDDLYRPMAGAAECDLRATADSMWIFSHLKTEEATNSRG